MRAPDRQRSQDPRCIDAALAQCRADEEAGRFTTESAQAHMARLEALLGGSDAPAVKSRSSKKKPKSR